MVNKQTTADLTDYERDQVERLALAFRRAVEKCDPLDLPIGLQDFPNGACGDATLLLGQYLYEQGYGRADYVLGRRGQQSHAWLELRGTVIDVTADQFEDYTEARFVVQDMAWHRQFLPFERMNGDFNAYDRDTQHTFRGAYSVIKAKL